MTKNTTKKKIALMNPIFCAWDGISQLIRDKAERLAKQGKDVTVMTLKCDNTIKPIGYKVEVLK